MRIKVAVATVLASLLGSLSAHAADLRIHRAPTAPRTPATLTIRLAEGGADTAAPASSVTPPQSAVDSLYLALPTGLDQLGQQVVFRFQLGQVLDEGQPAGLPRQSGAPLDAAGNRNTRFYTVGDLVAGSHGLLLAPLHSYLAAHFRVDQQGDLASASVPSIYDPGVNASGVLVRSAFAELSGLGGWLAPLTLRAGRQWRYGLAIAHFDGLSAWWDGRDVAVAFFSGRRTSLFAQELQPSGLSPDAPAPDTSLIAGLSLELKLARVTGLPLTLRAETLSFGDHQASQASLRWEISPDATLSAFTRSIDGGLARLGLTLDARLSRVTTLAVDFERRNPGDWIYDLVVRAPSGPGARFLRYGAPVRELRASGRAGTVLLDNLDVFGGLSAALPTPEDDQQNLLRPPYVELSGGADGRLKYDLNVALTVRWRRLLRPALSPSPTRFADLEAAGERWRLDGGVRVRYSLGRKQFATEFELFVGYRQAQDLDGTPLSLVDASDGYGGVRFHFEAWIGPRFRFLAEYEVYSVMPTTTELVGVQRLMLLAEASF